MAEQGGAETTRFESVGDRFEATARERLPRGAFDFFAGGAGEELTLADNVAAWGRIRLVPRVLRDVSSVTTSTTVLGSAVAAPILVAPVAYQRLAHPEGELAMARGCADAGSLMVISTRSSVAVPDIADAVPDAPRWFQVYLLRDRDRTARLVEAAGAAGCRALVLTADAPVLGRRPRDERNGFSVPDELFMPGWAGAAGLEGAVQDPAATFADIGWLREVSGLPVLVKGVLRPDDARECIAAGAAGIVVSNHGGRQLDGTVASADALAAVVEAVGGSAEVYVDGGVRTGVDVVRALALGARAVLVGRPALWGLAAAGAGGVRDVLEGLREELALALMLVGAGSPADVTRDLVA